jgi:hypothetical protein
VTRCRGCGAEYSGRPACPDCGLGASAELPAMTVLPGSPSAPDRPRRTGWRRTSRRSVTVAAAVLVALALGTLALVRGVGSSRADAHRPGGAARRTGTVSTAATAATGSTVPTGSTAGASRGSQPHRSDPASASPDPHGSPPGTGQVGVVSVAPALVDRPDSTVAAQTLSRYFTAINRHDRTGWNAVLVPNHGRNSTAWNALQTTRDSEVRLLAVTHVGGRLMASVSFTSRQDPAYAPAGTDLRCARWSIGYTIVGSGTHRRIDTIRNSRASFRFC